MIRLIAICFVAMAGYAFSKEIQWDESTRILICEQAGYGRMIRLDTGAILVGYNRGDKVCARASDDNGKTWNQEAEVAGCPWGMATNSEMLQLAGGRILYLWNNRPNKGTGNPYAIMLSKSSDSGKSWSGPQLVYAGGTDWNNGCWEPAAIQLKSGEVQLFFANEAPYPQSDEQEITLMRSFDDGENWMKPETVSFRNGHRDGMPVPLVLQKGNGIVLAIEDNGMNGTFKPVIIHTSLKNNWADGRVSGDSTHRWSALETEQPPDVYAGAPYICQMSDGTTVLSCQSTEGGRKAPRMVVYLGNDQAKHFDGRSIPFQIPDDTAGEWNALFVKDRDTITAICGTTMNGIQGLWAIDGHVH